MAGVEDRLRLGERAKGEDVKVQSDAVLEYRPVSVATGPVKEARTTDRVGVGAIVVIAMVASLGVVPWLGISMFADEGATIYSAHLSWSNLWAQSEHVDLVLLPYYVLVHFWILISASIEWVRALSLIAFFATLVVIGCTGLRIAGRWCGVIATVLGATSTILVEKALNARPYQLSTLAVVLCAVCLFRWLEDGRIRWMWLFSCAALLATAMQLFALFAPAAMFVGVLAVRPELVSQRLRAARGPLIFLGIPAAIWLIAGTSQVGQVNWIAKQSLESRLLAELRGPAIGQFYDLVLLGIGVCALVRIGLLFSNHRERAFFERVKEDRDVLALTASWAVLPTVVLAMVSFVHPLYASRYVSASAPGVALFAAFVCVRTFPRLLGVRSGYDRGTRGTAGRGAVIALIGLSGAALLAVGYFQAASALQEDLKGPILYAAHHAESGDVIAVPDHAITSVSQYYLSRSEERRLPLWPQLGVGQRYVEGFDLVARPPFAGKEPRRVWLLTDNSVPAVPRFERTLEDGGYVLVEDKKFVGSSLLLFVFVRPVTALSVPSPGATVSGDRVGLVATATSPFGTGVSKVQFVISGGPFRRKVIVTAQPYLWATYWANWNSISVPNGIYTVQSQASNSVGKSSSSSPVRITVHN